MTNQRSELIQGYLRIPTQLSEAESEVIEQIRLLLLDNPISPLAKQRLALHLIREVEAELSESARAVK